MEQKTLIIEIRKGGLGDHLFYSHLPRIAKQTKALQSNAKQSKAMQSKPKQSKAKLSKA